MFGLSASKSLGPGSLGGFLDVIWVINDSGFLNSLSSKPSVGCEFIAYDIVFCVPPHPLSYR